MERRGGNDYRSKSSRYRPSATVLDNTSDDGGDSETSSSTTAPTTNDSWMLSSYDDMA